MASIKQIEHRIKQSKARLKRLTALNLELESQRSAKELNSSTRTKFERQLKKNEDELKAARSTLGRLEEELASAQNEASVVSPPRSKVSKGAKGSDSEERLKGLEAQIVEMNHLEKQLELAQRSNLERFKQIQLQIRDLSRMTDRLLVVESQMRELSMKKSDPKKEEKEKGEGELFDRVSSENKAIYQPQSATTLPVGEPLITDRDDPWPWPVAMSRFLRGWLKGRKWWGHEDWMGLLKQIGTQDFSRFSRKEHHGSIGAFLEQFRGR